MRGDAERVLIARSGGVKYDCHRIVSGSKVGSVERRGLVVVQRDDAAVPVERRGLALIGPAALDLEALRLAGPSA